MAYPILRPATPQPDPGLPHTIPISDVNDLQDMQSNLSGKYYLTGNINAAATITWNGGSGFTPIGSEATPFLGTLDGCGYTVTGLFMHWDWTTQIGLFAYLATGSKVANLTLANVNITGKLLTGGLVGKVKQTAGGSRLLIQNCHVSGIVAISDWGGNEYLGGLAGWVECAADANYRVEIYDCTTSCTVHDPFTLGDVGGLIGWALAYGPGLEVLVHNCSATGNVTSLGNQVGGLIGEIYHYVIVEDSYATGDVSGASYVGGCIGDVESLNSVSRCSATGNVVATVANAGGFTSNNDADSTIQDCYATGNVTAPNMVGGLTGATAVSATCIIHNSYSTGVPAGASNVGGLNGYLGVGSLITECFWDTVTSGTIISQGGTGQVTSWMQKQSNFEAAGWDFVGVWYMPAGTGPRQKVMGRPKTGYPVGACHTAMRNVFG